MISNWLEPDWNQLRPDDAALPAMWEAVRIVPVFARSEDINAFLVEMERVNTNGGIVFARFELHAGRTFHWFASRNRWDEMDFFRSFLLHRVVRETCPELKLGESFLESPVFEWGSSLTLDGELARALVIGGPYKRFEGSPRQAKDLAGRFCSALFDDCFSEVEVFRSWKPWSAWFYGIAWDFTFIIIDKRLSIVTILCSTDTD